MSSPLAASPSLPPVLPAVREDFPTWLPAMLVKELRQGLRTRGFVGAFIVFQAIMVLLMMGTVFGSLFGNAMTRTAMSGAITGFFWTLLGMQLLLSTPVRSLTSLQVELESRALDLLVLTRLTAWRIVLGKWGSLMAQALLLFVAMLPYGIVRYFMGSVDLVEDAMIGAAMLGGCAVLTAAGLATSGLPKIVRIIVPVVVAISFQVVRPIVMMMGGGGGAAGSSFGFGGGALNAWLWWLNGILLLGLLLVGAVRRIAPPAENDVWLTRGLALLLLVPLPFLAAFGKTMLARGQLLFAAVVLAFVAAVELASMRWPMASHWRPWAARGALMRWVGRLALPGWPSAFPFVALVGFLVAAAINLSSVTVATDTLRVTWLVVLAVSGLVFPAVILSFFSGVGRSPGAYYGLVLGISCLLAAIAAIFANSGLDIKEALALAAVFPGAGFWIILFDPVRLTGPVFVAQGVVVTAVFGTAWLRTQIYWEQLRRIDARVRLKA